MCAPNFSFPSPLWKVTHCADWTHLTSKSNFRIVSSLAVMELESDASRFRMLKDGQPPGNPSCKLCGSALEDATHFISSCTMLEAKRRELLSSAPRNFGIWTYLTPHVSLIASHVSRVACIMLGIDWIDDIEVQVFCINDQLISRPSELNSPNRNHIPLFSGTLPEREATKNKKKDENAL